MKLPIFKLENYFKKYEFNTPYLLCCSDSETYSVKELLKIADEESIELWENLHLNYTEVPGYPLLRKEIAKLYQNVSEKGVGVFSGAEEAIYTVMNVLVRKGDHVIIPWPCYQSVHTMAEALGAEVSLLRMRERGGGWAFEMEDLEKLVRTNTRLIAINFPHNPTSVHIDRFTLEEIVACAKKVGAYLLSDEVYRFSEHRGSSLPGAADFYEKALSVGAMSKTFGMAGLRIGWLAMQDLELLEECLEFKCYLSICSSAPSEILALMALRAKETIIERNLNIMRRNLELLDRFFEKFSKFFSWKRPLAGATAFPKLLLPMSIEEFAEKLVDKAGVLLLPGSVYDVPGNYFRLGFARRNLPEALSRVEHFMKTHFQDRNDD